MMGGIFAPRQRVPGDLAPDQTVQPEPFAWGAGGARLSPEQLAMRQQMALRQSQSDYSPIQSVWQGVGRIADNALGALDLKNLDKQDAARQASREASVAALLGGGAAPGQSQVAAALLSGDPTVEKLGMAAYERANPKPVNNDTVADYDFIKRILGDAAASQYLQGKADPIVNIPQPGGGVYMGPRSGMAAPGVPPMSGPKPGVIEDGYRFKGGDPKLQSNWEPVG